MNGYFGRTRGRIVRMGKRKTYLQIALLALVLSCLVGGLSFLLPHKNVAADSTATFGGADAVTLPIVMYHQLTQDPSKVDKHCITVTQFEQDLRFLKEKGYETVTVSDLLEYIYDGKPLPKKPIMITVDDGYESIYTYGYPLLQQYDMCIVLNIIGSTTEYYTDKADHNLNYSYIRWAQAKAMADSGHAELQSHSYDLHKAANGRKGMQKMSGENLESYEAILVADLQKMQDITFQNTGYYPTAVAYPFGAWSKETPQILKKLGLQAAFTCEERINCITPEDPDCLYRLRRFNRVGGASSSFFAKLDIP